MFGLTCAKKYGGVYVPPHQAVIHQFAREMLAGGGKMILGSDSHTRYGALGTMAIGEGGPELVKQLCARTYDIAYPDVVAVHLTGSPRPGVGPQDVALAIIAAVFKCGFVKNKVMEFVGEGIGNLSVEYRNGIDVMTTETTCLSSIWETDEKVEGWYKTHKRPEAYAKLAPQEGATYEGLIEVDLSTIEPMIALPFHPSNAYPIREFRENARDLLESVAKEAAGMFDKPTKTPELCAKIRDGQVYVDQGVVAGCSGGTFENVMRMTEILEGHSIGDGAFNLSVYPASQPQYLALLENQAALKLMQAGAVLRSAFCGPCFGAGEVPGNGGLSIRHTTRNFPSREGSKPANGQIAYVGLMDARSIAATALNQGRLTAATEIELPEAKEYEYRYDDSAYQARVYQGWGNAEPEAELVFGPNIADWPEQIPMPENLLLEVASAIYDPLTTTDELIPSGETSSYRSNPLRLSEFALSRKDPQYVGRAKAIHAVECRRRQDPASVAAEMEGYDPKTTGLGSVVMSIRPGDGSAREQAASCQRVLGGCANVCLEYATKRYRSNVINWGMVPFTVEQIETLGIQPGDKIYVPGIRAALEGTDDHVMGILIQPKGKTEIRLDMKNLSREERDVILAGCLINYYAE